MTSERLFIFILMLLLEAVMISSCSAHSDGQSSEWATPIAPNSGKPQELQKHQAKLASCSLTIMIARTDEEKSKGLMFRELLSQDEGMLFCYDSPQKMVFWMKNTLIPLDIIFFSPDLLVQEYIEGMTPGAGIPDAQLPLYSTKLPAQFALELPFGSVKRLKIRHGDKLSIPLVLLFNNYSP